MINILILGLGHLSNGEITIALETLKHIQKKGFNLLFISHDWGVKYIESFGVPARLLGNTDPWENKKEFNRILKEFNPKLIICADVYTMEYASTWTGVDFHYLKTLDIPLGSFDQYEWEASNFKWDYMGAKPSKMRAELIQDCDFLIRPCPLNKPADFDQRIITVRLFGENPAPPTMTNNRWRQALNLPEDQKVVFTVNSGWEYIDVSRFSQISPLIQWMPRIIYHNLLSLKKPLTVVHVGPKIWDFDIDKRITYRYLNRMDAALYQETEKQADLFVGTNAISITLSKAVYAQTPAVLFQNLKYIDFEALSSVMSKMPSWYRRMAAEVKKSFTFRIFPWGWANFLKTVFENNPYSETFCLSPVFMPQKCKKILYQHLFDEEVIIALKEKQKSYFDRLTYLKSVEFFLEQII